MEQGSLRAPGRVLVLGPEQALVEAVGKQVAAWALVQLLGLLEPQA